MSMQDRRGLVIIDNSLVGIIDAPVQPFAWRTFSDNMDNPDWRVVMRLAKNYGWTVGSIPTHTIPMIPSSAKETFIISEDFIGLLERYGVPFQVEVSEDVFNYEVTVSESNIQRLVTQQFRLADRVDLAAVGESFSSLLHHWFATNVEGDNPALTHSQVQSMRHISSSHIDKIIRNHLGGNLTPKYETLQLMRYVLTPYLERIRMQHSSDSVERGRYFYCEALMKKYQWQHVW